MVNAALTDRPSWKNANHLFTKPGAGRHGTPKAFQFGTDRLYRHGSAAPWLAAAAAVGTDQSFTQQQLGHGPTIRGGDVGKHAAVIFRARYV